MPNRANDRIARQKELMELREELKRSVETEAYERAAELRDMVRQLESNLGGGEKEEAEG